MPMTEKKRKTDYEWRKKNKKSVACLVYREDADAFAAWCAARGKSVNEVLKEYIAACLGRPLEKREGPRKRDSGPEEIEDDMPE